MSTMPISAAVPTVLESSTLPHNGREARNLAEKHRRDKLNASIQELATMVPHVADSQRRMDKTAVLRFAAHGLRLQYVFGKAAMRDENDNSSESLQHPLQPQLTDALMQLLDSFFITLTCHGQIVLISSSVEHLLGHCQSDLYGQNIIHIVHPEDQALMLQQLIPQNMEALFRHNADTDELDSTKTTTDHMNHDGIHDEKADEDDGELGGMSVHSMRCGRQEKRRRSSTEHYADIDKSLREDRRCFTVRLARAGTRSETSRKYEIVMIDGLFRRSDCSTSAGNFPIVSQLIRRSRNNSSSLGSSPGTAAGTYAPNLSHWLQHDAAIAQAALHGISGNDIVLVAMARVVRPPKVVGHLMEANNLEYRTRHLIDGRIVDCDQRIGLVAGYMKDEVRNLCPFTFMHQDDVRWVIVALRQMYDCNSNYGESCYRLLSRNGHFIYLQTKGYLELDKDTNKVHSFVCINTLLDEEEGRRRVQEMKKKFSIIIKAKIPSNSLEDVPASQNPQQLERIVLYLIENLQKRNDSFSNISSVAYSTTKRLNSDSSANADAESSVPLSLVPPEPDSVKSSISKSVSIVNVTAARNLQYNQKSPASYHSSDISLSPASSVDHHDELYIDHATTTPPPTLTSPPTLPPPISQRPSVLVKTNTLLQLPQHEQCKVIANQSSSTKPTTSTTTTCKATKIENKFIKNSSPTEPVTLQLQQPKQRNSSTILKRTAPAPTNNSCIEESVSPAKRSLPSQQPAAEEKLFTVISSTQNNGTKYVHYTCSTMPTLLEKQLKSPKSVLLNNIKSEHNN